MLPLSTTVLISIKFLSVVPGQGAVGLHLATMQFTSLRLIHSLIGLASGYKSTLPFSMFPSSISISVACSGDVSSVNEFFSSVGQCTGGRLVLTNMVVF